MADDPDRKFHGKTPAEWDELARGTQADVACDHDDRRFERVTLRVPGSGPHIQLEGYPATRWISIYFLRQASQVARLLGEGFLADRLTNLADGFDDAAWRARNRGDW